MSLRHLLIAFLTLGSFAWAQYTTASLNGTVLDSSGAPVAQANVSIRNVETGFTTTVVSNQDGAYQFPQLPVGEYELRTSKEGFATYIQTGIRLTVNQMATQPVTLKIGQASEQVTVEANADLVDVRSGTVAQLVDKQKITELPLNGRLAQRLVFLAAGTVDLGRNGCKICSHGGVYPNEQTAGVNGAGMGQVNYQLDGVGHNDTYLNVNVPFPNPDSIQEFNLQASNFSAEYGNAGGGIVNIVTRSGTNQFHGSAFEFLRNGALNARNFFGASQDTLKRNQFGGSIGGPILRDKLFFFGTYQGTRVTTAPAGNVTFVPTAAERQGDFSGLGKPLMNPVTGKEISDKQISVADMDPATRYILNHIPLPNGPGRQRTYLGTKSVQNDDQFMPKVDYTTGKHQLSFRYFHSKFSQPAVKPPDDNLLAANNQGNQVRIRNVGVNHSYTISPNLLLSNTFGWNEQVGGSLTSAPFGWPDAGVKIANSSVSSLQTPPELILSINGAFSVGTNHVGDFNRGDYTWRENLTWIKNGHELHFGGELVRLSNEIVNTYRMDGSFTFNGQLSGDGVADFLFGRASQFAQGGGEFKDLRGQRWAAFVQDNWKVNSKLTLNLGARWDPWIPYKDLQGRAVCFTPGAQSQRYPNAPTGLVYGGDTGCPERGSDSQFTNIAPRIGFAYSPSRDGKTSIRGGFGYFYVPIQASAYNGYTNIAPFAPGFTLNGVSLSDPYGSVPMANPFPAQYGPAVPGPEATFSTPATIRAVFAKNFQLPLLMTWNFSLERQLGKDWVFRTAYIGNKGTHFFGAAENAQEINPAIYIPGGSTVGNTQARRSYQQFGPIGYYESGNITNYHSLQLNAEKRFSHGYTILANYTWSKKMDDYGWTNPYDRSFDYGRSSEDIPHNFRFSNVWNVPNAPVQGLAAKILNGWMLNGIVTWQSGFPFSVTSGTDRSLTGIGRDRADYVGGDILLASDRSHGEMIKQYFNTDAFVTNATGTFGTSGKNILRGPRYFNTDVGVTKRTSITETIRVEFRGELFNIFNNVNFTSPNSNRSSPQFGQITSALDPRIIQFGLKLVF